jgi:Fibronectin type III domain
MKKSIILLCVALAVVVGCKTKPVSKPAVAKKPAVFLGMAAAQRASVQSVTVPGGSSVTLAWDASPDASVVGYRVYYGLDIPTNSIMVGTNLSTTVPNLLAGATYTFAATAVDGLGIESLPSNQVLYTVLGPAVTNPPPVITLVVTVEHAATVAGPWTAYPTGIFVGPATDDAQVFRANIQRIAAP